MIVAADVRAHELLNEIYCDRKVGVEVGVFRGDLSWRLLGANRNLFLYMVDPWAEVDANDSYRTTDDYIASYSSADHEAAYAKTREAVSLFGGQYEILRMTSKEAALGFSDNTLDFVFIDADHSYEGCSSDIALWFPKLKQGGLLSGHDYRNERGYGVIEAVREFADRTGLKPRLGGNYTWFITKRGLT